MVISKPIVVRMHPGDTPDSMIDDGWFNRLMPLIAVTPCGMNVMIFRLQDIPRGNMVCDCGEHSILTWETKSNAFRSN